MKPPAAASTFASQAVNALLLLALALVLLHTAVNAPSRGVSVSITSVQARFGGAAGPLPETFSWQAYAFWNQAELGNLTQRAAEEHYACTGQRAGRLATTLPLFLSYDGKWGLCNQLFDHVEVLAFARWLNAALPVHATVAAPAAAYSRPASGYKQRFRGDEFQQEPLDSLLDVDRMAAHWADRGLEIAQRPDMAQCGRVDLAAELAAHQFSEPWTIEAARAAVVQHVLNVSRQAQDAGRGALPCVELWLGSPLWLLDMRGFYQPWLTEALRGIFFAPHVLKVADAILAGLRGQLAEQRVANFSAVHLRIEGDWVLDPSQDLLAPYLSEMRLAGFTNSTPCYFASAVFDYKAERKVEALKKRFWGAGLCGPIFYKRMLVPEGSFEGLHSEQRALLDLLVMFHADQFVGDHLSTFSQFAREQRLLLGRPRETFHSANRAHPFHGNPYPRIN